MNIEFFETFFSLMQTKNFTKTANITNISQSTVSNRIAELEKLFNVTLFFRRDGKVEPTPAAKLLMPYAANIIESNRAAISAMALANENQRSLHVGSVFAFYDGYMQEQMESLAKNPDYNPLYVYLKHSREVIHGVVSGKYDIGFSHLPCNYTNYLSPLLLSEDVILVTGKNPGFKSIKMSELASFEVYYTNYFDSHIEELMFKNLNFRLSIDVGSYALPLVLDKNTFTFIPKKYATDYINEGRLFTVDIEDYQIPKVDYYLIYPNQLINNPQIISILNHFKSINTSSTS